MAKGGLPKGMAQQIQALQQQLAAAQVEITQAEVTGTAGGGVVGQYFAQDVAHPFVIAGYEVAVATTEAFKVGGVE